VWQALLDDLKGTPAEGQFTVIAVALDQAQAALPWVEAGQPRYPCLIDADHHLADLYGFVNVPQSVWVDESGRMVRPPESAGASDAFRSMDREKFTLPQSAMEQRVQARERYVAAVRDWALHGAASRFALSEAEVRERLRPMDPGEAQAQAHFALGLHLAEIGDAAQAEAQFAKASALHPDSWAIWRRSAPKDARGLATGAAFWARVDALGDRPYYVPTQL
jgi:hypothetical protein